MNLAEFDAIIFDNDGVLVDSEIIHIAVEREFLEELGLHYDIEVYLSRFVGLSNADYYAELQADYAEQMGKPFPADFGEELHKRAWPRMESELQAMDGIVALVRAFQGKAAVGSSAPIDRLTRKLEITGLTDLFAPHIYSADHVTCGKPAPDLFLHAAKNLGIQPRDCAVIEDSVHGVVAARKAGMVPIGFVGGGHADDGLKDRLIQSGAEAVYSSHRELENLL